MYLRADNFLNKKQQVMKKKAILLTAVAFMSLTVAAQEQGKKKTIEVPDWVANLKERIELHGYGQAGSSNYTATDRRDTPGKDKTGKAPTPWT